MCLFSQSVRHVSSTRIFARPVDELRQLLVYSMKLAADHDVAMVLPVPVPPSSPEDAVRFVDMSSCSTFFDDIDALFPEELLSFDGPDLDFPVPKTLSLLAVHDVGDFEASFVPTRRDFERLDPRFRLPSNVFDALPAHADWGFCVFKLRAAPAGRDYHPMAFEFPRRDSARLFFPTVHVHDGVVHKTARFDHTLYCQLDPNRARLSSAMSKDWRTSATPVGQVVRGAALSWLDPDAPVYRRKMNGDLPNGDVFVDGATS